MTPDREALVADMQKAASRLLVGEPCDIAPQLLLRAVAALTAQDGEQSADTIENLATMLRRLIWQINKMDGDLGIKATAGKAKQLLWKYGLQGNLLRIDEQTADTVSVPREPTEAMLRDGAAAVRDFYSENGPYPRVKAVWRAILAAAKEGK